MIKQLVIASLLIVLGMCIAEPANAGSWIFRRSYYSHTPVQPVTIGNKSPYPVRRVLPSGAYVRTGYRNLQSRIQVGGQSFDHLNIRESWIQSNAY